MPAGFQYRAVASLAIDVKAPPIALARGPTPTLRNFAEVVPALETWLNPIPCIKSKEIAKTNKNFFIFFKTPCLMLLNCF